MPSREQAPADAGRGVCVISRAAWLGCPPWKTKRNVVDELLLLLPPAAGPAFGEECTLKASMWNAECCKVFRGCGT